MSETKKCPFCAEEINAAAILCKHCKCDLTKAKKAETCKFCGEEITAGAVICPHCSSSLINSDLVKVPIKLWTPNAVGLWSLMFSAIWGAVLVSKNWETLGETQKAKKAMLWCYGNIIVIVVFTIINLPNQLCGVYFAFWYWFSLRSQKKYIAEKEICYQRKPWKTPLIIGFAFVILLIIAFAMNE